MTFCGQWESTSTVTRNRFIVPVCPVCPVTKRSVMVNLLECISEIVCGWFMFENVCEEGLASQEQRSEEKVLTWQQDRKIMISLVCTWPLVCVGVCVFPSQGLGGLYHCDYPAAHDSEYKEDIDDPPPSTETHTHTHISLHHPDLNISLLCVVKHVTVSSHLLTGLKTFTLLNMCWLFDYRSGDLRINRVIGLNSTSVHISVRGPALA